MCVCICICYINVSTSNKIKQDMLDIIKINKYVLQKTPRKWEDRNIEDICKAYT